MTKEKLTIITLFVLGSLGWGLFISCSNEYHKLYNNLGVWSCSIG